MPTTSSLMLAVVVSVLSIAGTGLATSAETRAVNALERHSVVVKKVVQELDAPVPFGSTTIEVTLDAAGRHIIEVRVSWKATTVRIGAEKFAAFDSAFPYVMFVTTEPVPKQNARSDAIEIRIPFGSGLSVDNSDQIVILIYNTGEFAVNRTQRLPN